MAITFNKVGSIGNVGAAAPIPASQPIPQGPKFITGTPGLGKFGGNTTHALSRAAAVLARHSYDSEGMALLRNARVTNLAALKRNRVGCIATMSQLAGEGKVPS